MYRIKIDRSRCIGCLTCVTACVVSHETESGDARNRVVLLLTVRPNRLLYFAVTASIPSAFTHA